MAKKRIPQAVINQVRIFSDSIRKDNVPISGAYIFGSYAKGKQTNWSDIDLCIVSPAFEKKIKNPMNYLWSKRLAVNDFTIEPVGFSPSDFAEESPLISEIKKYGVSVR